METEVVAQEVEVFDDVRKNSLTVLDRARQIATIRTHEDFLAAVEFRKTIKGWEKESLAKCEEAVTTAHAAWKAVVKLRDEAVAPLRQAIAVLDPPLAAYNAEIERQRRVEQERLQNEARKREEDNRIEEAEVIAQGGDHKRAAELLAEPVEVAPVIVPVAPKAKGVSFREQWSCDPNVDLKALVDAIAKGQVPLNAVMPNMPVLNQMARALKGGLTWPGIHVVCDKIVATSSR
jgi:hypothetical protein